MSSYSLFKSVTNKKEEEEKYKIAFARIIFLIKHTYVYLNIIITKKNLMRKRKLKIFTRGPAENN